MAVYRNKRCPAGTKVFKDGKQNTNVCVNNPKSKAKKVSMAGMVHSYPKTTSRCASGYRQKGRAGAKRCVRKG